MNTRALALAAVLAGSSLGACTSSNESVSVAFSAICALTENCAFSAECEAQYIGDYVFDRTIATQYWLPIQVNNQLLDNSDESIGRVNTNDAHITSLEITYQGFSLASSTMPVSYRVPAAGSTTVGVYVVPPQVIVPGALARTQAVAHVVAKGYFEHGGSFETGAFPVPFGYCGGCLTNAFTCTPPAVLQVDCGTRGALPAVATCATP